MRTGSISRRTRALWTVVAAMGLLLFAALPGVAQPSTPVWRIAVFISSDKPPSTGPEEVHAIRDFVARRVAQLNTGDPIAGRRLEAVFYDDQTQVERTAKNVELALADPNVIGMIGIWNSTRGSKVIERIGESRIPFVSEMSVETLFAPYPNVYTLTRSVRDEQEIFSAFARDSARRIAFVGLDEDEYTRAYHRHLKSQPGGPYIASEHWLAGTFAETPRIADDAVQKIKDAGVDAVFLSLGSTRGAYFIGQMASAGLRLPVFIALGSISGVAARPEAQGYAGALYEIAEGGVANLNNERLERLMRKPGVVSGDRKFSAYAVGYGARYADLVQLIAEAAAQSKRSDTASVRQAVAMQLAGLVEGRKVWRGLAQDWSFSKERASAERSLLVWRPPFHEETILAPYQYVRAGGQIQRIPVLYVHLDMTRIYRVESNEKTFDADFYFSLRSKDGIGIDAIDFTNAHRGAGSPQPILTAREIHRGHGDGPLGHTRIYKISGRFSFEPDLAKYPFDQQILSISFQPANTNSMFLLQPPANITRGTAFDADGWKLRAHYVGTNDLIIHSIAGVTSEERVLPYYNFNYTWLMKRQVVDYVLRVIVPLGFIMVVAYLAVFIPRTDFEAIIAIQVTALLSAIALYLALSQPSADQATLSDQIFVMAYATISLMIALSIAEVNHKVIKSPALLAVLEAIQVYVVPVIALALMAYVLVSASGTTLTLPAWLRWRGNFDWLGG